MAEVVAYREWSARQWHQLRFFLLLFACPLALLFTGSFLTSFTRSLIPPGSWQMNLALLVPGAASFIGLVGLIVRIAQMAMARPGVDAPLLPQVLQKRQPPVPEGKKPMAGEESW